MITDIRIDVDKINVEYTANYKIDVCLEGVYVGEVISQVGVVSILEQIDKDEIIEFVRENLCCEVKE